MRQGYDPYRVFNGAGPFTVKRNGETLTVTETGDEAFTWILRQQGQSVEYALRYGGYSVHRTEETTK